MTALDDSLAATRHACLALAALLAAPSLAAASTDTAAILKAVDQFRTGAAALRVETEVTVVDAKGATDKQRLYTVYLLPDRRSLVLMRSPAEQGQKLLMQGDDFWLVMPNSQRPLRITAAQKLLGDASTGDIATMRWADDYTATLTGEEPCGEQTCLRLDLTSARKGTSYTRIDLWVGKAKFEPVKADLYVQSGKLAKRASFVTDNPKAPTQVAAMVLVDELSNAKETRIRYVSRQAKAAPVEWFNPQYLASNPSLE